MNFSAINFVVLEASVCAMLCMESKAVLRNEGVRYFGALLVLTSQKTFMSVPGTVKGLICKLEFEFSNSLN